MDLREYLESRNLENKEFAEMVTRATGVSVSDSAISTYKMRKRIPSLEIALAIQKATKGKVSFEDMLILRPKERPEEEEPDAS